MVDESSLKRAEEQFPEGLSSAQILEILGGAGVGISEATLRKYVQLGLLPRSVRVGQKGKHRGSHGLYPTRVLRQVVLIKQLLAADHTIEEIRAEFSLLCGDVDRLEQLLAELFGRLGGALGGRAVLASDARGRVVSRREVAAAEHVGRSLVGRLRSIEERLVRSGPASAEAQAAVLPAPPDGDAAPASEGVMDRAEMARRAS